jgi:hypothetical protein
MTLSGDESDCENGSSGSVSKLPPSILLLFEWIAAAVVTKWDRLRWTKIWLDAQVIRDLPDSITTQTALIIRLVRREMGDVAKTLQLSHHR